MKKLALLLTLMLLLAACSSEVTDSATDESTVDEAAATAEASTEEAEVVTNTEETAASDEELDDAETDTDGLDTSLFFDGALAEEATLVDCTLSDGTATQCYEITVVGTPVNHDVGPFCPTSITDGEDAGGLWLDGENSYVIDGEFFTELADIYGDELWNNIYNEDGSINVIDNAEDFQVAARPDITEEYYYHCVDGNVEWLDGGVQPTTTIQVPVMPVFTDAPTIEFTEGAHSTLGVTLNGSVLSGSADMAAILASYTIAAFDDCGGHINPALGYHVHGTAGCSDVGEVHNGETAPFAIAIDGHTIHAPYDADADVELDECNGHTSEDYGYHYHANSLEENATLTCLTGLTVEGQGGEGGPPAGGEGGPPAGDRAGGTPDFAAAAETLGVTEQELMDALGGPPPDLEAAAEALGVPLQELEAALEEAGAQLEQP